MKRDSTRSRDSMHETAAFIRALRRRIGWLLPRRWRQPHPLSSSGLRARRPARARMELDAESPAASWVAWEVSRRGRPPRQADSEQREG